MNLLVVTQKVNKDDQLLGFFISWLERFSKKFEKITVLCLEKGEFNLPSNIKVISLGKDQGASKIKQLFTFYFLLFTLRKDYDAVFVHMNPVWVVLGGISWKLMNKKIFFWYTHKVITPKLRLAEKFADTIFTASKESFRLSSKKVTVTGHGIDTGLFQPNEKLKIKNEKLMILSVGRIAPVKNYETLINAAKILKGRGIDFSVTMAGEAALERDKYYVLSIKGKIKNLGLGDNFKFVGKINHKDLPELYWSHDLFIHLSKTGSVDKVLLEAMACGMKVLSSNDSARSFLPQEFIFGENNSEELAGKIIALIKNPAPAELREYVVQNHDLDKLINRITSLIHGV